MHIVACLLDPILHRHASLHKLTGLVSLSCHILESCSSIKSGGIRSTSTVGGDIRSNCVLETSLVPGTVAVVKQSLLGNQDTCRDRIRG